MMISEFSSGKSFFTEKNKAVSEAAVPDATRRNNVLRHARKITFIIPL